jgi:hypothetical protein
VKAPAAKAATYRRTVKAPAAKAATYRRTVKAPAAKASAHPGIRRRRRRHRAGESDGGQRDYDLTHHGVSSICRKHWAPSDHRSSSMKVARRDRLGICGAAWPRQRWARDNSVRRFCIDTLIGSLLVELMLAAGRRRQQQSQ